MLGATGAFPFPTSPVTAPMGSSRSTPPYRRMAPTAWLSPHSHESVWLATSVSAASRYQMATVASPSSASPLSMRFQPSGAMGERSRRVARMATRRSPLLPEGVLTVTSWVPPLEFLDSTATPTNLGAVGT